MPSEMSQVLGNHSMPFVVFSLFSFAINSNGWEKMMVMVMVVKSCICVLGVYSTSL